VAPKGYVPEKGELRFDMFEAEFTHVGDRCTFEVLIERMGLDDAALRAIAEIVHDIDLKDDKYARPETAGARSAIAGVCASSRDDRERIAMGSALFDALYASGYLRRKPTKDAEERVRRLVRRLKLPARDLAAWLGILRQIVWKLRSAEK